MRPDYVFKADRYRLKIPHLRRLLSDGAHALGVRGVVATVTYPSHTTILTGVWPPTWASRKRNGRDLWAHRDLTGAETAHSATVPPHGCLHVFGMIGILAMSSGLGTTASKLRGTGESAYSTLIQKHLPGDVE